MKRHYTLTSMSSSLLEQLQLLYSQL